MALDEPDRSVFDEDELSTMAAVLDELRHATGTALSELSHDEPVWRLTETGETIPIHASLLGLPLRDHSGAGRARCESGSGASPGVIRRVEFDRSFWDGLRIGWVG